METPSPYDSAECQRYTEQCKRDNARKEYITKEIKKLREHNDGSISPYDLSQMALVNQIYNEAKRMFR
jgi:hypothetical protein